MGRRIVLLLVAAAFATLLASAAAVAADGAERGLDAKKRTKVITRTFSNTGPIAIPIGGAASPYPSERNVAGFKRGRILDVNVTLKNFSHTLPEDVDVLLSKGTRSRTIMSDVGSGIDVNNITLKLDDEAATSLPDIGPLVGGTFKPTNIGAGDVFPAPAPTPNAESALSGFDGMRPNGTWRLYVNDDTLPDGGAFAGGWSITIKAKVRR